MSADEPDTGSHEARRLGSLACACGQGALLVDVSGAEPDRRRTAADVDPLVVGIGDMELPSILSGVAVGMTDK